MGPKVTIACVYKPGNGFTDEYVYRMRESVARHVNVEHRFVVFTSQRFDDFETMPLSRRDAPGWWNKLDLFSGVLSGPVWYFDLDTMIESDITDMVETPFEFAMLSDFYRPQFPASGVMAWNADFDWSHLYEGWTPSKSLEYMTKERWGDQGWIRERVMDDPVRLQDAFPARIESYKVARKKWGAVPKSVSVICFHGKPRPADVNWRVLRGD